MTQDEYQKHLETTIQTIADRISRSQIKHSSFAEMCLTFCILDDCRRAIELKGELNDAPIKLVDEAPIEANA